MDRKVAPRVALVTGSTQGIGLGIARRLASCGCSVILTGLADVNVVDKLLEEFSSNYAGKYHFVPGDLRDPKAIENMCKEITGIYPEGIDILINNAGFQHVALVEDYPVEIWSDMVAVHMTAPFLLTRYFLPFMKRKKWGRIVSISSQMAMISSPGKSPYSATKAGLVGFTKGVAIESASYGVTCNAICPGYVETDLLKVQIEAEAKKKGLGFEEARKLFFNERHPTGQPVTIEQVASMVAYLCSEDAASITGSAVTIDAGNTSR